MVNRWAPLINNFYYFKTGFKSFQRQVTCTMFQVNKSTLFNEGDTRQSVMTGKPVALRFQIKSEFRSVGF